MTHRKLAEQFYDLFRSSDLASGVSILNGETDSKGKKETDTRCYGTWASPKPATISMWESHLLGKDEARLAVIPIDSKNTCWWGMIDVDISEDEKPGPDKINPLVQSLELPAVCIPSKSFGTHIYFFFSECLPAGLVLDKLRSISAALGWGTSEIYPSQSKLVKRSSGHDVGHLVNMPYFCASDTTYGALGKKGEALEPEEFLAYANSLKLTRKEFEALNPIREEPLEEGPPCLQHIISRQLLSGNRNNVGYQLCIYAKKRYGSGKDDWKAEAEKLYFQYLEPAGLPKAEFDNTVSQLAKKEYQYKCTEHPFCVYCDKKSCLQKRYGVGNHETHWPRAGTLQMLKTDPPLWILETNSGGRLCLNTEQLLNPRDYQRACQEQLQKIAPLVKKDVWDNYLNSLNRSVQVLEVDPSATLSGTLFDFLCEFLSTMPQAESRDDIRNSQIWLDDEYCYFLLREFKKFLERQRFTDIKRNMLPLAMRDIGASETFLKCQKATARVWKAPLDKFLPEYQPPPLPDFSSGQKEALEAFE